VKVWKFILESSIIEFIWLSTSVKMKAWEYFKRHSDKSYSFTDCASFMLMGEKAVTILLLTAISVKLDLLMCQH